MVASSLFLCASPLAIDAPPPAQSSPPQEERWGSLCLSLSRRLQNHLGHFPKFSVEVLVDITLDTHLKRNFTITTLDLTTSLYLLVFYSSVFTVSAYFSLN